jgi:predicted aspartyl protease
MNVAKRECPSCGKSVLKAMLRCPNCRADLNAEPTVKAVSGRKAAQAFPQLTTNSDPTEKDTQTIGVSLETEGKLRRFLRSPLGWVFGGFAVVVVLLVATEEMRRSNFSGVFLPSTYGGTTVVNLQERYGVLEVPFSTSDGAQFYAVVDSGASDIVLPGEVVAGLLNKGILSPSDYLGKKTYILADGSSLNADVYSLNYIKVGDLSVRNVTVAASQPNSGALLGQSFFKRFKSWSIDNRGRTLTIVPLQ